MANNNGEVPRTVGTPSFSGASGASKAAPSVEYSSSKLGEQKTSYDGNTPITESPTSYSAPSDPMLPSNRQAGFTPEKEHYAPCINPSCKSYGKSHPNCRCYAGPGGTSLENGMFAKGGEVHFCLSGAGHHEKCEHFADGGTIAENMKMHTDPVHTIDHVGVHQGMLGLLTKVGHSRSENPNKQFEDYVGSYRKGHKSITNQVENIFGPHRVEPNKHARESLKNHLQDLRQNPEKLLEIGGALGSNLPSHGAVLAAKAGDTLNHFNAIKPLASKNRPLDELMPADKRAQATYDRHIDLANNPSTILNHVKDGTLLPSDISGLQALYPKLYKTIVDKAGEALIDAQTKGLVIPYKQKQSLSMLLGTPLDSTMTQSSMQAIIKSAGPQQMQSQMPQKKPKKASGVELNQLNKINAMDATALQDRQMDKAKD